MNAKKLGFGAMRLPLKDAGDPTSIDLEQLSRMVDTFLARGFTYFDTAYMYHQYASETALRQALVERHPRESFTLADKLPLSHLKERADMARIFDEQLQKCGVTYFDYYLLHNINSTNITLIDELDAFAFVAEKKAQGQVKKIGFSYHDNAQLLDDLLQAHPETEFVQLQLNYLDWDNANIQSRLCYEVCQKHGKPVVVMEPIKGGTLAVIPADGEKRLRAYAPQASPASWAVRYAASLEGVMMVLSGMSDYAQLDDNTSYMQDFQPLNDDERAIIHEVTDLINQSTAIGCTACQYCVEGCPQHIPIPNYFALYNQYQQFGQQSNSLFYYSNYAGRHGKASDCLACGQCESHCPQHLPIIEHLRQVADVFEENK